MHSDSPELLQQPAHSHTMSSTLSRSSSPLFQTETLPVSVQPPSTASIHKMSIQSLLLFDEPLIVMRQEQEPSPTPSATPIPKKEPTSDFLTYDKYLLLLAQEQSTSRSASRFLSSSPPTPISSHTQPGDFECYVCGKQFKRKHHLESHMVTHSSDYPFACSIEGCRSKFRRVQDLRRHIRNVRH
ncbi:hypothetical protein BCR33DRAFT_728707 [Rhizoclosmatium globosum]|uniref:C2H2-type domain-containing protein n=1 Tax=Rhizoclosmatium globosum TaxID=329046 RepID=A0A1Y2AJ56_9FUNG|nr:hypothetical protein BCR33DRAFT_728707 [Rhizoclosmatium globosum]|eukprot:ORY22524.1 hypothetical protein BCR33DRAFT_728707 [Rhizoclosmatium globosum]